MNSNTRSASRGKVAFYVCAQSRKYGKTVCRGSTIQEDLARRGVESLLLAHLQQLNLRRYLEQAAEEEASQSEGAIAQTIMVELQQTETKLQRLVDAVADGALTNAEVRNRKLDLLEKKERLEARLKKLQTRASVRGELYEAIERVEANLPDRLSRLNGARFRRLAMLVLAYVKVGSIRTGSTTYEPEILDYAPTDTFKELCASDGHVFTWPIHSRSSKTTSAPAPSVAMRTTFESGCAAAYSRKPT